MRCNICGKEFGKGEKCQHCGADKVAALGEFEGFSNAHQGASHTASSSHLASIHREEPALNQICWKCNEVIPADAIYCPVCRQELKRKCPKCGKSYSSQYHNCPYCGTNYKEFERELSIQKERKRESELKQARIREQRRIDEERAATEQRKKEQQRQAEHAAYMRRYRQEQNIKKKFDSLKESASSAHELINGQEWITIEQKAAVLPLLEKLNAEIDAVSKKEIHSHTSLSGIQAALEALENSESYQLILDEKERRIDAERSKRKEEKARIIKEKKAQFWKDCLAVFVRSALLCLLCLGIGYFITKSSPDFKNVGFALLIYLALLISTIIEIIKRPTETWSKGAKILVLLVASSLSLGWPVIIAYWIIWTIKQSDDINN